MLRLICGYAPQSGRSLEEKQSFYDELKCEWDMHSADDLVMCLEDFNGHFGRHIDGVHQGYGVGHRNCVWGRNCVCQIHGLRERKRGR